MEPAVTQFSDSHRQKSDQLLAGTTDKFIFPRVKLYLTVIADKGALETVPCIAA